MLLIRGNIEGKNFWIAKANMTDFRRTQNTFGDAFPVAEELHGGFNFDNYRRNELIMANEGANGAKIKSRKTGTTICGVVFNVSIFDLRGSFTAIISFTYKVCCLYFRVVWFLALTPGQQVEVWYANLSVLIHNVAHNAISASGYGQKL